MLQLRISIHALRVEGDNEQSGKSGVESDFYPRPPGGGRHRSLSMLRSSSMIFLSTPSGWRATHRRLLHSKSAEISIHALRVEGDGIERGKIRITVLISIHALRVEGDVVTVTIMCAPRYNFYPRPPGGGRPGVQKQRRDLCAHFYPRPPGGGRPRRKQAAKSIKKFLSTPSGWRATSPNILHVWTS